MESYQGSELANNGPKQEIEVFPGMENEKNDDFSAVNENERQKKVGGMNSAVGMCSVVCGKSEELKGNGSVCERRKNEFLVGDLVWGKLRNHPWWPGLIYDPADASDFASKFKGENKLLVAYFGDGSCGWSSLSDLVPFVEHYGEMSKQSSSKRFVCSVEKALEELGRRVALKMVCSCVPEGNLGDLARPEAMNAGVRSGILVPNGAIDKIPSPCGEPAELLSYVRNVGLASPCNLLELVLMKSWLASFSRLKRGCSLPIYREPQLIEGLEDICENAVLDTVDFSVPIQGSSEEEHSGAPNTLPFKGAQKRNMKSVAELMGEDKGELKGKKTSKIAEKTPSTTTRNRKAASDDDINESGIQQSSTAGTITGRKKIHNSDSHATLASDVFQIEKVDNESTQSTVLKKKEDPIHDMAEDSDEKTRKRYISRERKNSKYLCEPYTVPFPQIWRSYSKKELETKFDKIVKSANDGDRLTKVAGHLISSPGLTKCNSRVSKEEMSVAKSQKFNEINASANQVVGEVLSAAVDISSMDRDSIEPLRDFMNAFRSSAYSNISYYKLNHNQNSSKKRKSPGDNVTDLYNAGDASAQPAAYDEKIDNPRSRVTKLKKVARAAAASKKEVNKTAPVVLIVSFVSDAYMPSKDEIIQTFTKFGSINEDETELLHDSNCARVVFISSSNAELAFKESIKQSPFPGNKVEYNLRYSSDASRALESRKTTSRSPRKKSRKNSVPSQPTDGDVSHIDIIHKNLLNLTSMLNQCNGNISVDEKSNMECQLRSMLQKVGDLEVKASS